MIQYHEWRPNESTFNPRSPPRALPVHTYLARLSPEFSVIATHHLALERQSISLRISVREAANAIYNTRLQLSVNNLEDKATTWNSNVGHQSHARSYCITAAVITASRISRLCRWASRWSHVCSLLRLWCIALLWCGARWNRWWRARVGETSVSTTKTLKSSSDERRRWGAGCWCGRCTSVTGHVCCCCGRCRIGIGWWWFWWIGRQDRIHIHSRWKSIYSVKEKGKREREKAHLVYVSRSKFIPLGKKRKNRDTTTHPKGYLTAVWFHSNNWTWPITLWIGKLFWANCTLKTASTLKALPSISILSPFLGPCWCIHSIVQSIGTNGKGRSNQRFPCHQEQNSLIDSWSSTLLFPRWQQELTAAVRLDASAILIHCPFVRHWLV